MSITKRYLTSLLSMRSGAELMSFIAVASMSAMPTVSPRLIGPTFAPMPLTRPAISRPGAEAQSEFFHALRAVCGAEWQTPPSWPSIRASSKPGSHRPMPNGASGVAATSHTGRRRLGLWFPRSPQSIGCGSVALQPNVPPAGACNALK